jgi:hypothetical protein
MRSDRRWQCDLGDGGFTEKRPYLISPPLPVLVVCMIDLISGSFK